MKQEKTIYAKQNRVSILSFDLAMFASIKGFLAASFSDRIRRNHYTHETIDYIEELLEFFKHLLM